METTVPHCQLPGCPIASGGRCLDGFEHPEADCPNYAVGPEHTIIGNAAAVASAIATTAQGHATAGTHDVDTVALHPGAPLNSEEAQQITRGSLSRVIVVAGMAESGKTSLVTCIYHKLLEHSVADYAFAGSLTLPAFEERCHHARLTSGREAPSMPRTTDVDAARFLHLQLAPETRSSDAFGGAERASSDPTGTVAVAGSAGDYRQMAARNLLITDIAGEAFRLARDSEDDARRLTILRRADRLAVLVDGAKLAKRTERQGARRDVLTLLQSLTSAGMIDGRTVVDIVVTKWDLIDTAEQREEVIAVVDEIECSASTQLCSAVAKVRLHRVAALPVRADIELGFGVDALLRMWLEESYLLAPSCGSVTAVLPLGAREYLRFGERHWARFASAAPHPA